MAHTYQFYYVGDHLLIDPETKEREPLLLTFSKNQYDSIDESALHMHAYLEFFYVESGFGVCECNNKKILLSPHDLLVINPQTLHQLYCKDPSQPLVYYNIAADHIAINGLPQNYLSGKPFEHHHFEPESNEFYHSICLIQQELKEKRYHYATKVHSLFHALMIDVIRLFENHTAVSLSHKKTWSNQARLSQVKAYMESHYADNLSLQKLASLAMLQKSYLIAQFKAAYGISPTRYLNLIRMENAKLLLANSSKNITEIAAEVGFNHPSYFSEMFLKTVGVSPTLYRQLVTQNELPL